MMNKASVSLVLDKDGLLVRKHRIGCIDLVFMLPYFYGRLHYIPVYAIEVVEKENPPFILHLYKLLSFLATK